MVNSKQKSNDVYSRVDTPEEVIEIRNSPFSKEIQRIVIRSLFFEIVLHKRHYNFFAPVTPT